MQDNINFNWVGGLDLKKIYILTDKEFASLSDVDIDIDISDKKFLKKIIKS